MKKLFYYFLLSVLISSSCSTRTQMNEAIIAGQIPGLAGRSIYLRELEVKALVMIDSTELRDNGDFMFKVNVESPAFYILETVVDNRITLLIDKNEKVEIHCPNGSINETCTITGSPGSSLLLDFENFMYKQKNTIDSLAAVFYANEGSPDFLKKKVELDSAYNAIFENQRTYVKRFIDDHPASLASLLVLNRKLGRNKVLDEEEDFIYFHRIDSALNKLYPGNKHVIDHHNRVEQIKGRKFDRFTADEKLQPGKKAPNIVVYDTSNKPLALKSLEGKKVLVYFWAGWNAKSRKDNRELVKLYPKLKAKNIELFGVSVDETEIVWKGAVKLDKLPGIQGSELKGMNSEVMKDYNLNDDLPHYYLVDEERIILFREKDLSKIIEHLKQIF